MTTLPDSSARAAIRFLLNGEPVEASGVAPQTTLLEFLREHRGLPGTKEGCAEGDCGACTVVLAEPADDGRRLAWRPVNACIRLLPSVAGRAVFTVESLCAKDGTLHPAQRALVDHHGSQCGFCTPGFVMSLFGLYKNAHRPDRAQIENALSGNLCRCTGYRPIVDAALAMYDTASSAAPAGWRAGIAADGSRDDDAEARLLAQIAGLTPREGVDYSAQGRRWRSPSTLGELAAALVDNPGACIVAGATDVGLWITKQQRDLGDIVCTAGVAELREIRATATHLEIGAAATLTDAFAALEGEWPETAEAWARFASVPIRNSGTLGGNVANGSPIGDSMPVLMALDATAVLRQGATMRELPVESLYLGYQKTALQPGEFIVRLRVPRRAPRLLLRAYKISKRYDQDISAVFACFALVVDHGRVASVRIGCGGVAATPRRATATEGALIGRTWDDATAAAAMRTLANEFTPIGDMRASAAYRREVLANLFHRFRLETAGVAYPTRVEHLAAGAD